MPATHNRIPQRLAGLGLIVLLVLLAVLRSQAGTRLDGYTVDEPWHIVAGVSYLRTGDFRLNPEHPPLAKLAVAVAIPDSFKLRPRATLAEKTQERALVEDTMFFDNDSPATQASARIGMWSFHGAMLLLLGMVLWRGVGLPWAAGTLAYLALEPSVGAHLPVVMTDLPLALGFGLAVASAGLLASEWRWRWVLACGVAVGLCLGSKHSALAGISGIALVLALASVFNLGERGFKAWFARVGKLAVAAALSLLMLWGQYGLRFHAGPDGSDGFNRAMADKISDVNIVHWREGIAFADRHRLLPRTYLWGLADTVRAGLEGRGQASHRLWGVDHKGTPPWFTWPSFVVAKVPLALLALSLLGLVLVPFSRLSPSARWTLAVLLGGSATHFFALLGAQGTYGGIRHALPLVVALAILGGAAVSWACTRRSKAMGAVVTVLLLATVAMTIREPRLWEYHNELAGGTQNAWRAFGNEGLDLGQRFPEIRAFHDRVIKPEGSVFYSQYWFGERQAIALGLNYRKAVSDMDDDNVAGIYEGYFLAGMSSNIPEPAWNWDPVQAFKNAPVAQRLGYLEIRKGRMVDPLGRAANMYWRTMEYLYREDGKDTALVAKRLEEVVKLLPLHLGAGIELGNAHLRLGNVTGARVAYQRLLDQEEKSPIEPLVRGQLQAQLARMEAGEDAAAIPQLRNPSME